MRKKEDVVRGEDMKKLYGVIYEWIYCERLYR